MLTLSVIPSKDGAAEVGPNERAFLAAPRPNCNCKTCNPKYGEPDISCMIRLRHRNAIRRDQESLKGPPEPVVDFMADDQLFSSAHLSQPEKRIVWAKIQADYPDLYVFLKNDVVQALLQQGGVAMFPIEVVRQSLGYVPN